MNMKYIRKIVVFFAALIFLIAVIVGLAVIFAVKNVNVTFITYTEIENLSESQEIARGELKKIRGTSMLLVEKDDVLKSVDGGEYNLVVFEKVYPCTLNIKLEQRVAVFNATINSETATYDGDGNFLKNAENESATVKIVGASNEEDILAVANVCKSFKSQFGGLKSLVQSVTIVPDKDYETVVFSLYGGFEIDIVKFRQKTDVKCECVAKEFKALSDLNKTAGSLHCFERADGTVVAEYKAQK